MMSNQNEEHVFPFFADGRAGVRPRPELQPAAVRLSLYGKNERVSA